MDAARIRKLSRFCNPLLFPPPPPPLISCPPSHVFSPTLFFYFFCALHLMPTWRAFLSSCTYIPSYLLTVSFSGPGKQPPSPFTRLPTPTPHSTPSPSSLPFCVCVCVCVCLWVIFPRASAPQSPRVVFAFLRFSPVAPLAPSDWSTPVVTLPKGGCRDSLTAARSQSQVCLLTRLHV